ncbi:MAG: M1 family metallopeptidase [Acidobacteriota bacterium]
MAAGSLPTAPRAVTPDAVTDEIAGASLQTGNRYSVHNVDLRTGAATFRFRNGVVYPATPVAGRVMEMLFVGHGRILLDPPDAIEAHQLDLFTDSTTMDAPFHEAILVVTSDEDRERLLATRDTSAENEIRLAQARRRWEWWKNSGERRVLGVEPALFRRAIDDVGAEEYFAAHLTSGMVAKHFQETAEFFYAEEPQETEQVTLGRFTAFSDIADADEARRIQRILSESRRHGRNAALQFNDLGRLETWMKFPLKGTAGRPGGGLPGFEPERYEIDVEVDKKDQHLTGVTRLHLVDRDRGGRRSVQLTLSPDYTVNRIVSEDGNDLFFNQVQNNIMVVLDKPAANGGHTVVQVEYTGNVLAKVKKGSFVLGDTFGWYPHAGSVDRAVYDVTFRWPWWLQLVASGKRVEGGQDKGMRWERRRLDFPSAAFAFQMGKFELTRVQAGHVAVTFAYDKDTRKLWEADIDEIQKTTIASLQFFEQTFGPYPLDQMTVVTLPQSGSQGFLGFIMLSSTMIDDRDLLETLFRTPDRRAIIAHEIAHQWWGHLVGWRSYRDQWLSEAMAEYSSLLYSREKLGGRHQFEAGPFAGWDTRILQTFNGMTLESLGPVVLGNRLAGISAQVYSAIIYTKGGLVLDMLSRRFIDPKAFPTMLSYIVKAARNGPISTEEFILAIEKMSGADLTSFAQQYIYGTGVPLVFYSYTTKETANGQWHIAGEVRQFPSANRRVRVVTTDDGPQDVIIEEESLGHADGMGLVLPFQVQLAGDKPRTVHGRLPLRGGRTPFALDVQGKPERMWFDRNGEVLALCLAEDHRPKTGLLRLAIALRTVGESAEAETVFRQALDEERIGDVRNAAGGFTLRLAKLLTELLGDDGSVMETLERELTEEERAEWRAALNRSTHIEMARLFLDEDRLADARQALDAAKAAVPRSAGPASGTGRSGNESESSKKKGRKHGGDDPDSRIVILEARLALKEQRYDDVSDALGKAVESSRQFRTGEVYALLAAAACGADHVTDCAGYAEKARARGVTIYAGRMTASAPRPRTSVP